MESFIECVVEEDRPAEEECRVSAKEADFIDKSAEFDVVDDGFPFFWFEFLFAGRGTWAETAMIVAFLCELQLDGASCSLAYAKPHFEALPFLDFL